MKPCAISWCVACAHYGSDYCVVHGRPEFDKLRLVERERAERRRRAVNDDAHES